MTRKIIVGSIFLALSASNSLSAQSRTRHAKVGAAYGALIGVVGGAVIGALNPGECLTLNDYSGPATCDRTGARVATGLVGGFVFGVGGTALGAIIGALRPVGPDSISRSSDIKSPPSAGDDRHAEAYPVDSRLRLRLPDPIYGSPSYLDARRP